MRNRVLVVDDERFFLEAIDEILAARAATRPSAPKMAPRRSSRGGSVGLASWCSTSGCPTWTGSRVLAKSARARPELRVIMLSASTDQEIVLEALRLGACDYLAKPLHDEELVLAVGRGIDGHEAGAGRRRLQRSRRSPGREHGAALAAGALGGTGGAR